MQNETTNPFIAALGTVTGLMVGVYQSLIGNSLWQVLLTTALTATVSCLVSFLAQQCLSRFRK